MDKPEFNAKPDALDLDVDCIKCGYNLRGLVVNGTCPECGAPVALSADPQRRAQRHQAWINKLRRGLVIIVAGDALGCVKDILYLIIWISSLVSQSRPATLPNFIGPPITICFYWLWVIAWCVGWWLLTTTDPTKLDDGQRRANEIVQRWIYGLTFAQAALMSLSIFGIPMCFTVTAFRVGWGIVTVLLAMGLSIVMLRYLSRLAERMAEPRLARKCQLLLWLTVGQAVYPVMINVFFSSVDGSDIEAMFWWSIIHLSASIIYMLLRLFTLALIAMFFVGLGRARTSLVMMNPQPPA